MGASRQERGLARTTRRGNLRPEPWKVLVRLRSRGFHCRYAAGSGGSGARQAPGRPRVFAPIHSPRKAGTDLMLIRGTWRRCGDGVIRPIILAETLAANGQAVDVELLLDTGADRTMFSAATLRQLALAAGESKVQL